MFLKKFIALGKSKPNNKIKDTIAYEKLLSEENAKPRENFMNFIGLSFGVLSMIGMYEFSIAFPIIAIVFSHLGIKKVESQTQAPYKGFGKWGRVLGYLYLFQFFVKMYLRTVKY